MKKKARAKSTKKQVGEYVWADGTRSRVPPEVAAKVILDLERRNGACRPADLLAEAQSVRHPLHRCFDWNDRKAAKAWRLQQASQIIITIRILNPDLTKRRVMVNIPKVGYNSMERVATQPDLCALVLRNARDDLAAWEERYKDLRQSLQLLAEASMRLKRARRRKKAG